MPRNLILALASDPGADWPSYLIFLKSFAAVLKESTALVVLTGDAGMPVEMRSATREHGGRVVELSRPMTGQNDVGKYWYYSEFLHHLKYKNIVLTIDPFDTIIQRDPFEIVKTDSIYFSAEGSVVANDRTRRQNSWDFNDSLDPVVKEEEYEQHMVLSDDFMAGPDERLAHFCLTRYAMELRGIAGDRQASITAMADWISSWPGYRVVPMTQPWIYHGHWSNYFKAGFDHGVAIESRSQLPYAVFHQWNCVKTAKPAILRKYT